MQTGTREGQQASTNGAILHTRGEYPDFIPGPVDEIEEKAALEMARSMRSCKLEVPLLGARVVETAYVEALADDGEDAPSI